MLVRGVPHRLKCRTLPSRKSCHPAVLLTNVPGWAQPVHVGEPSGTRAAGGGRRPSPGLSVPQQLRQPSSCSPDPEDCSLSSGTSSSGCSGLPPRAGCRLSSHPPVTSPRASLRQRRLPERWFRTSSTQLGPSSAGHQGTLPGAAPAPR